MASHITPRSSYPMRSGAGPSSAAAASTSQPHYQQHPSRVSQPPQTPGVKSEYSLISEEDREHIDEVFDLMDMKKKGHLNSYEFRHSLSAFGFEIPKPEYCNLLETYGVPSPEWLDSGRDTASCPVNRLVLYPDQFRACTGLLIYNRDPREEATKVFRMYDYDGDGIISFDDMRHLAADIKEERTMTDEEISTMIEHLDHDGKGGVNLEEFIQMMEEAG